MTTDRMGQVILWSVEIDGSCLPIIFCEDASLGLFILWQAVIDLCDGCGHGIPSKSICKLLGQHTSCAVLHLDSGISTNDRSHTTVYRWREDGYHGRHYQQTHEHQQ